MADTRSNMPLIFPVLSRREHEAHTGILRRSATDRSAGHPCGGCAETARATLRKPDVSVREREPDFLHSCPLLSVIPLWSCDTGQLSHPNGVAFPFFQGCNALLNVSEMVGLGTSTVTNEISPSRVSKLSFKTPAPTRPVFHSRQNDPFCRK
jgi:hypothetical protein